MQQFELSPGARQHHFPGPSSLHGIMDQSESSLSGELLASVVTALAILLRCQAGVLTFTVLWTSTAPFCIGTVVLIEKPRGAILS